ncbi:DUF84 family protein [Virgibacillus alimentarius]|uniref:inosine/xanthosine triphosphatase n=1 Tax=Virgibacillus alimentarius TaxID=698769 RepID=A0ABS4SDJ1_9BACI|nr:DUF84 family protein [Virgibacillus alimentarius]MBP2259171.1 inosine/xanthosine triphosphatase [Virgibacillus alimentarius]
MRIIIGSKNPTKWKAVQDVFDTYQVDTLNAPSRVSSQPFSDEETREGAINRALQCAESTPGAIGIGLEGGVMYIKDQLYLCNWGALVTEDENIYTASGARIVLPIDIAEQLKAGSELGDIMDQYTRKEEVRENEGAIGIFTNDSISRRNMFVHVVKLLRGQWEYWINK